MKKYFALLFLLLLIAGCGQKTTYVCGDQTQVEDPTDCSTTPTETVEETTETVTESQPTEVPEETVKENSYVLSDTEKALLAERFTPSTRAVLSTPLVKNLHVGDAYVVGLALQNILGSVSHDFVVTVKFREAKDFSGSVLQTDDALIQAWLEKNIFTTYTLDRGEKVTIPIIVEVGDTLTEKGNPVVPGTYIYDVYIGYITNAGNTDEYQNLVMTIQVTE